MDRKASKPHARSQPKAEPRPVRTLAQPKPPLRTQPALTEKDRAILADVENIIWNPDRLKKLENDGKARKQAK
jgi:hypothetical protein